MPSLNDQNGLRRYASNAARTTQDTPSWSVLSTSIAGGARLAAHLGLEPDISALQGMNKRRWSTMDGVQLMSMLTRTVGTR